MATITSPRTQSPAPGQSNTAASPIHTPSSSVRHSMDYSTTSNTPSLTNLATSTTNAAATAQRRNRAALRDYYNLKSRPPPQSQSPVLAATTAELTRTPSNASNSTTTTTTTATTAAQRPSILPPSIDSPTFDAESYISSLLSASTLRDVLTAESTLVSEIRTLDGERKALVYDNYSKLIRAVSTIGEMRRGMKGDAVYTDSGVRVGSTIGAGRSSRTGAGGPGVNTTRRRATSGAGLTDVKDLDQKLERLFGLVEEMKGTRGDTSEDKVAMKSDRERRKQQELVRWVLSAPDRLQALVQTGNQGKADDEWVEVMKYLGKWDGVKGVEEVRKRCEAVMKGQSDEAG